jgi:hypothetical protein
MSRIDTSFQDRLDRIQTLVDLLMRARTDLIEQQDLSERIHREIEVTKFGLRLFTPQPPRPLES